MIAPKSTLAGLLALSAASASTVDGASKRGSFKLPLTRKAITNKVVDDTSLSSIYQNTDWTTFVSFGGQNFSLQVDTGSADLWVLSAAMPKNMQKQFPDNHFYDGSKSKTFKAVQGGKFNISYAQGQIYGAGDVGTDNVAIGSASVNMPFGLGTDVSPSGMVDTMYDGILGLAFGSGSTQTPNPGPTFMEAVQSQLDAPVFTFNLPQAPSGQMIEFGHVDKSLYTGNLQAVAINNGTGTDFNGWMATASFSVNGKNITKTANQVLFDTGGLTAAADPDSVAAYWKQVKGAKDTSSGGDGTGWAFPCSGTTLPDLSYDFLGTSGKIVSAVIPGKFMNSTQTTSDGSMCMGSFLSWGSSTSGTVGYGMFHAFFTVFDQSVPSVSFAPYPQDELNGKAPANNLAASSGTDGTVSATTTQGFKTKPPPGPTGTAAGASHGVTGSGTGSGAVAATAAPTGASDSAPKGNSASGLTTPSAVSMSLFAAFAAWLVL